MIPDQDVGSDAHPLVVQTRELTLLAPGTPGVFDGNAPGPAHSDRASSFSSRPSSPSRSRIPREVSMPERNGDVMNGPEDAQPPSCPSESHTCSHAPPTSEKPERSCPPSCIPQPNGETTEIPSAGRDGEEAAAIVEQDQCYGDQYNAAAAAAAAAADQPAVPSAKSSCVQSAGADSMVYPREVSSAAEPEWKANGVFASGRMTKRSPAAVLAPPLGDFILNWCGRLNLDGLPNEVLMHILSYLEVCDLLATSRTNHHLRSLSLQPILQHTRLHRVRYSLPTLLLSPSRPTLSELIARHIFLTHTTQISRRLARSLVAIRLSRRLPLRPSAETLVQRGVLPGECVEGMVAPGLVAKKRAVERERLKDGLRRWVGGVWKGEVRQRSEGIRKWEESRGVGRVWRLRRFWEHVSRGGDELR